VGLQKLLDLEDQRRNFNYNKMAEVNSNTSFELEKGE
jgi:hypothetical protein